MINMTSEELLNLIEKMALDINSYYEEDLF